MNLIDTLLFYLRFRYLSATECLVYLFLYTVADRAGRGYVRHAELSERFGRSGGRCRIYLNRLKRHGLIDALRHDTFGGAHFKLEVAVIDPENLMSELEGQNDGRDVMKLSN